MVKGVVLKKEMREKKGCRENHRKVDLEEGGERNGKEIDR